MLNSMFTRPNILDPLDARRLSQLGRLRLVAVRLLLVGAEVLRLDQDRD